MLFSFSVLFLHAHVYDSTLVYKSGPCDRVLVSGRSINTHSRSHFFLLDEKYKSILLHGMTGHVIAL